MQPWACRWIGWMVRHRDPNISFMKIMLWQQLWCQRALRWSKLMVIGQGQDFGLMEKSNKILMRENCLKRVGWFPVKSWINDSTVVVQTGALKYRKLKWTSFQGTWGSCWEIWGVVCQPETQQWRKTSPKRSWNFPLANVNYFPEYGNLKYKKYWEKMRT